MITKIKYFIFLTFVSVLFTECASVYHNIDPSNLEFNSDSTSTGIIVDYQRNLLTGKYLKREIKSDVQLVAVKIKNNTAQEISLSKNINIISGEKEIIPISLNTLYDATQQNPDKSLMFLFFMPLNGYSFSQTTSGGQITSQKTNIFPVGLILAPALAFGNKAVAKSANKKFKKELEDNDIYNTLIHPGEIKFGFIAIKDNSLSNLTFTLKK